jgi:hypothetical protein
MTETKLKSIQPEQQALTPPVWLRWAGYWFRIGLGFFLLFSVLMSMAGCSSSEAAVPWQKAAGFIPESLLEQVIQTQTELNVSQAEETLLVWSVEGKDSELALFNFNTPDLCGALGCLYAGYWLREGLPAKEVFLSYLDPNLPVNHSLFQVGENRGQALPCLEVLQTEQKQLRQLDYCFNGDRYQLSDSHLFS